jgi:hypothetical protein
MIDKAYHWSDVVMRLELFHRRRLLGTVVRSAGQTAFAYDPTGIVVGQYADLDAAAAALARRQREAA